MTSQSLSMKRKRHKLLFLAFLVAPKAVKCGVKMVTKALTTVCGVECRDGYIKVQMKSRGIVPFISAKHDYVFFIINLKF